MPYPTAATPDVTSADVTSAVLQVDSGRIDFPGLAIALLSRSRELLPAWFPAGKIAGHEFQVGNLQGEPGESLSINVQTGRWADFAGDVKGGDLISLFAAMEGVHQGEAAKRLSREIGFNLAQAGAPEKAKNRNGSKPEPNLVKPPVGTPPPSMHHSRHGAPSRSWRYLNAAGETLFYIARYETPAGKVFSPWSWDSISASWVTKAWTAPRPLYGLDLLANRPDAPVLIVEGEKAAEAARDIVGDAYVIVTWPGGASGWRQADWSPLKGRKVLLWPDADRHALPTNNKEAK